MIRSFGAGLAAAALALPLGPQDKASPAATTVVRAGRVHVGDGRVLEGVRLTITGGKIGAIGKDEGALPAGARVLDFRRQTLIPGLVAAHTELTAVDQDPNLTPDVIAAEQFDFYRKWPQLIAAGLTTVYLSPGRQRLMPGQGSVVKLAGKDAFTRLLSESAAMRVNLSPSARNVPAIFEPVETPTADDPLLPARKQFGSTRSSQIQVLRDAFREAADASKERGGRGRENMRYDLTPLRAVAAGRLPVRLATLAAADALHGLDALARLGAKAILERPVQVLPVAARLAEGGTPCIVAMPLRPSAPNPGDYRPGDEERPQASPETAGALSKAGVRVAIVPASDTDLDKLRMLAGLSCRYGLDTSKALSSITLDAARILGVDKRVGSLEAGKDADFVVLSGAPFDARTNVEQVFVDGESVFERKGSQTAFAIRAGRVLLGDGTEQRNALVVVRGSKIIDVGPNVPVPAGAQVIDASDSVLVPGYVAAASKLGLHADRGTAFPAATSVDVAAALEADDPAFARALEAGVTTLFVTPDDTGLVGGRVCAVKTHGQAKGFVVRPVTGIRMRVSAGGKAGTAKILGAIKKARTYIDPPKKKAAPAKKPAPKKEEAPKAKDPISGTWKGTVSDGPFRSFTVDLKLTGAKVEATLKPEGLPVPLEIKLTGTFGNNTLDISGTTPFGNVRVSGKLAGNTISGKISTTQGEIAFSMTRTEADAAESKPEAAPGKKKDKPKKDESLEPWRTVLAKRAPLVARVSNADAARAAIDAIAKQSKLKLVLTGQPRAIVTARVAPPEGTPVGYILGSNEVYYESKGKTQNVANDLTKLGYRVILVARAQVGTRYLPVHAAWAVATGLDARKALSAISGTPADCFGLGDRVGRIHEGCDADLVLLSGDPFDLTTRIRGVWVDGVLRVNKLRSGFESGPEGGKDK